VTTSGSPAGSPTEQPATVAASPLPGDAPAARHRLPTRTLTYWRVRALITGLLVVGLLTWWAAGADWFTPTIRWTVDGAAVVWYLLVGVLIRPVVRWKLFWYAVSDDEIDLQHGWLVQTRTVVPMNRVQHLKSEQGLLAGRFRLAVLHIHTAAGPVVVAGLDQDDAAAMRVRIGRLAHLSDDL
jgi:membrane protein YdbS with pleckstrin-like domain